MSFRTKLITLISNVAKGSEIVRFLLTPIGAIFFLLFAALFVFLSFQVDRLLNFPKLLNEPLNNTLSVPLILIGFLLYLGSALHFLSEGGTPVPFNPPPKLVTTGLYAYSRNPMLTAIFILLFGIGVQYRSLSLVFIFTPLFILINVLELKAIEEPELEKRLGEEYIEYKKKTPMFFPKLRIKTKKDK